LFSSGAATVGARSSLPSPQALRAENEQQAATRREEEESLNFFMGFAGNKGRKAKNDKQNFGG
jgi:hypothetical protein